MMLFYRNVDMLKYLNVFLIEILKFKVFNNLLIKFVMGYMVLFKCIILEYVILLILMCLFNMYLNIW